MNMTLKEMKDTKLIVNIFIALAGIVLLISLFTMIFKLEGIVYSHTDDVGEKVGYPYLETLKVYHFASPFKNEISSLYFSWEMMSLYLILFVVFVLNFINFGKYNSIKQYIIGAFLILAATGLILLIGFYKKELNLIVEEFLLDYFEGSTMEVSSGSVPFLAYALTLLAGFLSIYKAWIVVKIGQQTKKNQRRLKK